MWRRPSDVNRSERLYGSQRMFGFAVYEWCVVHQFGTEIPLSLRLFGRILGRKLSISARGTNIEIEHGSAGSHSCLSTDHIKWANSSWNLQPTTKHLNHQYCYVYSMHLSIISIPNSRNASYTHNHSLHIDRRVVLDLRKRWLTLKSSQNICPILHCIGNIYFFFAKSNGNHSIIPFAAGHDRFPAGNSCGSILNLCRHPSWACLRVRSIFCIFVWSSNGNFIFLIKLNGWL